MTGVIGHLAWTIEVNGPAVGLVIVAALVVGVATVIHFREGA